MCGGLGLEHVCRVLLAWQLLDLTRPVVTKKFIQFLIWCASGDDVCFFSTVVHPAISIPFRYSYSRYFILKKTCNVTACASNDWPLHSHGSEKEGHFVYYYNIVFIHCLLQFPMYLYWLHSTQRDNCQRWAHRRWFRMHCGTSDSFSRQPDWLNNGRGCVCTFRVTQTW